MSYEPTIVIKKADLDTHRKELDNWYLQKNSTDKRVYEFLNTVLQRNTTLRIDGIELLVCQPELTQFNECVRSQLYRWDVQYGESN